MRYIGNKTRLLDFIGDALVRRRIRPGRAVDPFTGTASVARELKRRSFAVQASDIMHYGYIFARAYVEVAAPPRLAVAAAQLGWDDDGVDAAITHLNGLPGDPGFIHEHYSPAGQAGAAHGRMYFMSENAARIDVIRTTIERWRAAGWIDDDAFYVLLAALLEAADRVANTTGVYAAFVKTWQANALRPLELRVQPIVPGNSCHSCRRDALEAVREAGEFDLLYLDPPYNSRQYAGYYHIPELIARGWFDAPVPTRGKTGLMQDAELRTDWSRSRRCEDAFEALIANARCKHIVMSYNAEGIIPEASIARVLKSYGRRRTYARYPFRYRRYRSDADGAGRTYRADSVDEYLYCIAR